MYLTIKLQLQATHDEKQILRAYSRRFRADHQTISKAGKCHIYTI